MSTPAPSRPDSSARPKGRLRRFFHSLRAFVARLWASCVPGETTRRGAERGALIAWLVVGAILSLNFRTSLGVVVDVLLGLLLAFLIGYLVIAALRLTGWLTGRLRQLFGWIGVAVLALLMGQLLDWWQMPVPQALAGAVVLVGMAAALGGGLAFFLSGNWRTAGRWHQIAAALSVALPVIGLVAFALWLRGDGKDDHLISLEGLDLDSVPTLELGDPGGMGPYEVERLTYGSGSDRQRPEYGAEVTLTTESVDGTDFFEMEGLKGKLRRWFWGFDLDEMPRNGRVWAPRGPGPFPLVLIVHGNHNMADYSDPGYAYLGELLASRGAIFVSVDENFLNGHFFGGTFGENDARGWMLLKHLELWRDWNGDAESPFAGRVDLERVILIGHSRGGEAAAIAACFNRLDRYPDDGEVEFSFDFGIQGVVAIAPSDGQYRPADRRTPVAGVHYLVLQGGHDGDVSSFSGDRQYERVEIAPGSGRFKASLYAYRANHGQFNTGWGRTDMSLPFSWLLNLRPLLDGEAQRRIARTYISAFVEVVAHGKTEYTELFRDSRRGRHWLPADIYLSRFQDDSFELWTDFEEDVDLTHGTLPGSELLGEGLTLWREEDVAFRYGGRRENHAVYLGWNTPEESEEAAAEGPPSYTLRFAADPPVVLAAGQRLVFDLAASDEEAPEPDEDEEEGDDDESLENESEEEADDEGEKEEEEPAKPIDLTIELIGRDGAAHRLTLSQVRPLPPALESRYAKLASVESERYGDGAEVLFQTYEIPLGAFGLELIELVAVRFVFDRQPEGVVVLDRIGRSGGASAGGQRAPSPGITSGVTDQEHAVDSG